MKPGTPFHTQDLRAFAKQGRKPFQQAEPYPHLVIDRFLQSSTARRLWKRFPAVDAPCWQRDIGMMQTGKLDIPDADHLLKVPAAFLNLFRVLNGAAFLDFLEELTGIEHLIPDPHFLGGGLHQILPGGRLSVHTDFNFHPRLHLYRRLNIILYLNPSWRPEYGGDLELWDGERGRCVTRIAPSFNRLVIFETAGNPHGHPQPLTAPPGLTRKSLALYYYTAAGSKTQPKTRYLRWEIDWSPDFVMNHVLPEHLRRRSRDIADLDHVFQILLEGKAGGTWSIDLRGADPTVRPGPAAEAVCSLTLDGQMFVDLIADRLYWEEMVQAGKVRFNGPPQPFFELLTRLKNNKTLAPQPTIQPKTQPKEA